jgi:glycerol-3-phosphate dehydrogenase
LLAAKKTTNSFDVLIVGAGVVGCAIARELARYRARVLVLDMGNDVATGASKANSGIVHGGYDEKHGTLKSKLARPGNQSFAQLNRELHFGFRVAGSLVVAFNDEERQGLEALLLNGQKNGVQGLRIVDQAELRRLEPHISPQAKYALHCPHTGITSPYEYAIALAENAIANGVDFRLRHRVTDIRKPVTPSGSFTIHAEETKHRPGFDNEPPLKVKKLFTAHVVINCAGLYSDRVAAMVGAADFNILPRKGEYLVLEKTQAEMARHVLFPVPNKVFGKGVLVSQTYWGNLLLGPTSREPGDHRTNIQVLQEIIRNGHRLVPDVDVRKVITSYSGNRAKCDRGDFIVEESSVPRFINCAGIDSPGLTSSPAVARRVLDILKSKSAQPFQLQEKLEGAFQPQREPIVKSKENFVGSIDNPDPVKNIICRCERITEAEIVDALYRPLSSPSVTSIKRRTRAGMGVCQGKFCQERVIEVIAKEMGISKEEVPGLEPGSSVLPHRRPTEEDKALLASLDPNPEDKSKL